MARIFAALALLALLLLVADLIVGLLIGDYNRAAQELLVAQRSVYGPQASPSEADRAALVEVNERYKQVDARAFLHRMLGILAALVTVLVNSISITYFIGTGRWCREVVDAYQLDVALAERSRQLKRKTFPWSLLGILLVLAISTTGAAGDPAVTLQPNLSWVLPHLLSAIIGSLLIGIAFFAQMYNLAHNQALIEEITALVQHKRAEL